ncbi:MAG: transpeptidase family protein [Myxococcaceae bacterium]|nr:transpeptidase family protein [Myxococcaceae bacterium]
MRDLKHAKANNPGRWLSVRVRFLGLVFLALLLGVFGRAMQLQVRERQKLTSLAQDQYLRELEIPARRGDIVDRRGVPLAQSVEVDSVWVDPSLLPEPLPAARALAKELGIDTQDLLERLEKGKRFAWVKRQVTPLEVQKVKALDLPGVGFTREPKRFYPQRELAAQVLGLVGTEGKGLDGLELAFEDELSGEVATRSSVRDAKGRKLFTEGREEDLARHGASISLTLDRHLQYLAEKALTKAVEDARAAAGTAVVLDPRTGELLAIASAPRFNPNAPQGAPKDAFRDRAVTDAFEPGSTFKAFVVAAALDEGLVTPTTTFDCENGAWRIGRHTINDTHPHASLDVKHILQVSSNIGAAKIAQKLGREKLVDAYARFGFGERAGLGLPSEGRGVVPFPRADVALAAEAFGQGLTATAVQLAAGYGALANDGVLMRPWLVQKVTDADGVVLIEGHPQEVRRVVSPQAARTTVAMLESVVEKEGTAPRARLDEYRVSGKTGTAQKVDPVAKGYSDKRIASFIGMVPAEAPRLVILVVIDEPKTDVYGGLVAAPAFKEIATAALPYLAVKPSRELETPPSVARADAPKPAKADAAKPAPAPEPKAAELKPSAALAEAFARVDAISETPAEGSVRVPDLRGIGGREAISTLLGAALVPQVNGSGRVASQSPAPGSLVVEGSRVTLELASALPAHPR